MRREKLFWLCAGAALIILVVSLIPSHYKICEIAEKTKEEHCPTYRVLPFVVIKIGKILDFTALGTLVIAAFTGTLWWSTRGMQRATLASIDLANREFISTHRPRLILREAFCVLPPDDTPMLINLTISNIGETRGTIIESVLVVELFRTTTLALVPVADGKMAINTEGFETIEPGQNRSFGHFPIHLGWDINTRRSYAEPDRGLFFSGHIVYIDDNKVRRQTAFRRKYDPANERFYRIPGIGEEHEYAD